MQHSQPLLASSVAEQCWQLSPSLPHIVLNVTCIEAEKEASQPKVAALIYFPGWSYLLTNNTELCFKKIFPCFVFFFLLVQKGIEEVFGFFFLSALNYFLSLLILNDLF